MGITVARSSGGGIPNQIRAFHSVNEGDPWCQIFRKEWRRIFRNPHSYGRPGFQQFTSAFHSYWIAGLQFHWSPWTWGATDRERGLLRVQQQVIDAEEASLAAKLERQVQNDLATIDRLERTLGTDERIIALRETVEHQARVQLGEHAILTAEYLHIRSDLQESLITRDRHRVELARARAGFLTTLGIHF